MDNSKLAHLQHLQGHLSNAMRRYFKAKKDSEDWRSYVLQIEEEITKERKLLGLPELEPINNLSDEQLLTELQGAVK